MWLLYWWWCVSKINLPTETRNGERNRMFYGFGETLFTEERAERFLGGVPDEPSPIPSSELDFLFLFLLLMTMLLSGPLVVFIICSPAIVVL